MKNVEMSIQPENRKIVGSKTQGRISKHVFRKIWRVLFYCYLRFGSFPYYRRNTGQKILRIRKLFRGWKLW